MSNQLPEIPATFDLPSAPESLIARYERELDGLQQAQADLEAKGSNSAKASSGVLPIVIAFSFASDELKWWLAAAAILCFVFPFYSMRLRHSAIQQLQESIEATHHQLAIQRKLADS